METKHSRSNNHQLEKEVWSKPEIALISINDETLSLADDAKKLAHFLFIS